MIRLASIGALLLLGLSSCKKDVIASAKWSWKDHNWITGDAKTLQIQTEDTTNFYQLDLKISHEETYAFQNLYVRTTTTYPSGKEVTSITSLELIDDRGRWAGDYGENCCKLTLPLQQKFTFPEIGGYSWRIEPYMRVDTVKGINGLKITCKKWKE